MKMYRTPAYRWHQRRKEPLYSLCRFNFSFSFFLFFIAMLVQKRIGVSIRSGVVCDDGNTLLLFSCFWFKDALNTSQTVALQFHESFSNAIVILFYLWSLQPIILSTRVASRCPVLATLRPIRSMVFNDRLNFNCNATGTVMYKKKKTRKLTLSFKI